MSGINIEPGACTGKTIEVIVADQNGGVAATAPTVIRAGTRTVTLAGRVDAATAQNVHVVIR